MALNGLLRIRQTYISRLGDGNLSIAYYLKRIVVSRISVPRPRAIARITTPNSVHTSLSLSPGTSFHPRYPLPFLYLCTFIIPAVFLSTLNMSCKYFTIGRMRTHT